MDHVNNLILKYFDSKNGELIVGDLSIVDLVKQFDTPFYLYYPEVLEKKLKCLNSALPGFEKYYSVKSNPTPAVLHFFLEKGCGLNVATYGELLLAIKCGCPPSRILLAGSGKTDKELEAGVEMGVSEIHVESIEEIKKLSAIAKMYNHQVQVALRINPGEISGGGEIWMEEKPAAYGLDETELETAANTVMRSENLNLCGLNAYFGTQNLDYRFMLCAYEYTFNIAERLAEYSGCDLKTIDFGGGFGVPYYAHEREFCIDEFGKQLQRTIKSAQQKKGLGDMILVVEPGRYLVAEGGLYVTKVIACKKSYDKRYIIVDGGIHHHLAATGNLGHVIKRNFPLAVANRLDDDTVGPMDVTGRQCSALDTLARDVILPDVKVGDIIVFFQSGAYARSVSPMGFRSHPEPIEIFIEHGRPRVVRRKMNDNELFRDTILNEQCCAEEN